MIKKKKKKHKSLIRRGGKEAELITLVWMKLDSGPWLMLSSVILQLKLP